MLFEYLFFFGPFAEIGGGFAILFLLIRGAVGLYAMAKIFEKAGKHWWMVFIPGVYGYTLNEISWKHGWCFLYEFVPILNIFWYGYTMEQLAANFGQKKEVGILMIILPEFFAMELAEGDSKYIGFVPNIWEKKKKAEQ